MKKKLLSLVLIACMLVPLLPALPFAASAQKGTLGYVGSSTTLYDDIAFSESKLPMTYGQYLASGLISSGGEEDAYRSYVLANKNVTWHGAWSLGAVANGVYEKQEYNIPFVGINKEATSGSSLWQTTASGMEIILDQYLSGNATNIWGAAGAVLWSSDRVCVVRMPGVTSNVPAIAAYGYTVQADGVIGFSMAAAAGAVDTDVAYETAVAGNCVIIRVNDKIVFPENATLNDRTTWANYSTMTALRNAMADLRMEVKAGDVVQFCMCEKNDTTANAKYALNPVINTYASTSATEATSTTTFATDRKVTIGTPSKLYPNWDEAKDGYRVYALNNKNVAWSGNWSVGAVIANGAYEPIEYIASFAHADWHTTASGFAQLLETYLSNGSASIWGASNIVLQSQASSSVLRFPGSNAQSGIGAFAYTVPADSMIGLSLTTSATDSDMNGATYESNVANAYVMIRVNDKIVFPQNATLNDRTTWGTYTTISALHNAIADLRLTVKAGDVVQFCLAEKSGSDPKMGFNPTISTYESETAETAISSTTFSADKKFTRSATIQLFPAWKDANVTTGTETETATDTEANRQLYREYLLTCGKLTQSSPTGWQVGGYTGANGAFEPIAYRIPFTGNGVFNTTDTSWSNLTWYTTTKGYEYLTDLYIRDTADVSTYGGIWQHSGVVLYQKSQQTIRSSNDYTDTFVYRWTVPAGAGGQVQPYFDAGTSVTSNLRLCIVYDGQVIWPEGASLSDSKTWEWGNTSADGLNEALAGLHFDVEPGKTLDFCGTAGSANDTKLNITINYSNIPKTSTFTEDGTYTVGAFPMVYSAYLTANSLTDGADAKASYKEYLMQNGKITYTGSWSRGAINVNTGAYEVLDHLIPFWGLELNATAFKTAKNQQWTTNSSTYATLVDRFIANEKPGVWNAGTVIQSLGDTVRFRLPGNTAQSGIFAYAYEIPADGGGLVGFQAATDTVVYQNAGTPGTPYEGVDKMYVSIMINGTPVWPQGATRNDVSKWGNYADVDALNAALADAKVYTKAGDLVQLCVRENDPSNANAYLALDPIITFYSDGEEMSDFEASVSLGSDLALNIFATAANETVLKSLEVTLNGETATPSKKTVNDDLTVDAAWTVSDIAAKEMTDEITYSFKNKADGHVYASGTTTLATILGKYIGTNDAATWLAKATLNYGAAAQNYFSYNTANLANSQLPTADQAIPENIKNGYKQAAGVTETEGAIMHWEGATLLLNDVLTIKLLIDADKDLSDTTLTLKQIDENGVAVESEWPIVSRGTVDNGRYYKILIEIPMVDYTDAMTFGVYANGELISDLLTYGVGAYACRMYKGENPDAAATLMNNMAETIVELGKAAQNYQDLNNTEIDHTQYVDVRELESNLLVVPSLMQTVNTRAELRRLQSQSPSHALLRVAEIEGTLYVTNEKNEPIATLDYALTALGGTIIPVLDVDHVGTDAMKTYLASNTHADLFVFSSSKDTINALREAKPLLHSILDARARTIANEADMAAIVKDASLCASYVCLFTPEQASSALSNYFNHRYMIAWYEAKNTTDVETVRLVTAGAGGIMTTDRKTVEACLCNDTLWAEGSLNRVIPIIGHQGSTYNPTTQANTIGAMKWAQENGATLVEFDVRLTMDDYIVLMHDEDVDGTTDGTGKVAEMTLEEIKALWVNSHSQAEPERVPTFEEVLIAFQDTDMILNIEIKCGDTDLVPIMVDLIREYDMVDQCRVCCFYTNQIAKMREYAPEIPTSVISGSMDSLESLINTATTYESAYFVKFDKFDYDNLQKLAYRGIGAFMWTPDAYEHIYATYAEGPWSLCLNWVDRISDVVSTLETTAASYSLTAGGSTSVGLLATTYVGDLADTSAAEMVIISGNETLSYANGTLSATAAGEATVMFRMKVTLGDTDMAVYIYTAPVTVTVN